MTTGGSVLKISDFLIMSDVDGTLLPFGASGVPERNLEALRRFTGKGGRFGIATGRAKTSTEPFVRSLPVNAPCVIYNGGGLYDYDSQEFLMQIYLPEKIKEDIARLKEALPSVPIVVVCRDDYLHVNKDTTPEVFSVDRKKQFDSVPLDEIAAEPWNKAVFLVPEDDSAAFDDYIAKQSYEGVRIVRTTGTLVELLPENSNKGAAIERLVALGYAKRECIAAIGDYYNDIEMIRLAGIGATTAEAPDDIKAEADFITGPSTGGAVADLVEYLESIAE
jgi:Cof subfamily protein (haloacid dehalogenase superfamily)